MQHKTPTKRDGIAMAKHMKKRLLEAKIPVINVYLFGSTATGKTHKWSDIDIAVVYEPFDENKWVERRRIRHQRDRYDFPIDIICFRPEELDNKYHNVTMEIKEHGIPV